LQLCAAPVAIHCAKAADILSRKSLLLLFTALPLISLSFSGCASMGPTYEGRNNILNDDQQYKLGVIEFGELGSYADAREGELNDTVELLKNTERPLLVVYIHGWLNNATSGDVGNFRGFLSRLAQSRQVKIHHYNVFGVYFAWPGKTLALPYLDYLTFWNRKQAAERIASTALH
jgi:hypothetical protein